MELAKVNANRFARLGDEQMSLKDAA